MADQHDALDDDLIAWIEDQPVFFVGTAPGGDGGHVNVSPKGHDTFRVLGPRSVAYLDLTGSGVETIAHLQDNGRICFLFCAFAGKPRILRLQGTGSVHRPGEGRFEELRNRFGDFPGVRSVITAELDRIATSCGYAVPLLHYEGERRALRAWADKKGPEGVAAYQATRNARSIDGLPGVA